MRFEARCRSVKKTCMHKGKAVDDGSEAVTATTATTATTDFSLATAASTGGDDRRRLHGGERPTGAER